MKTKLISIILFLVLVISCIRTLPDEELTMTRTPYYGKEIKLDGCFVSDPDELNKHCEYYFFYSNGALFSFGDRLNIVNLTQITGSIDILRKDKRNWGVYQIKNDTIWIQRWRLNDYVYQNIVINYQYKIINDTTLFYGNSSGNTTEYHFKKFSSKPDSTNVFIK